MKTKFPFISEAHIAGRAVSALFRLPFQRAVRHGHSGNWLGAGVGSSIDFQDHREYVAGDDPRYIDWRAYARTGNYSLKLYREEVTPKVDVVLDLSSSMLFQSDKGRRSLELMYFTIESALRAHASLRCYLVSGSSLVAVETEQLLDETLPLDSIEPAQQPWPDLSSIAFRAGSMRVLISDLLYPEPPKTTLGTISGMRGQGVIMAPYSSAESEPDWDGNILFNECETGSTRRQWVDQKTLENYRAAYARHFRIWTEECLRNQILFGRFLAETDLQHSLEIGGLQSGVLELCR